MNAPLDIEPILDRWLGAGDDLLPDRVLDAALGQVEHVAQRRPAGPAVPRWVPWRPRPMLTLPRLALGAAAVAAVLVGALAVTSRLGPTPLVGASPSSRAPSIAPSITPGVSTPFHSVVHGYTVDHAAADTVTPATRPWLPRTDNLGPDVDRVALSGTDSAFVGASSAIQRGSTWDSWLAAYHDLVTRSVGSRCSGGDPATWKPIAVGPETGLIYTLCNGLQEAVVHVAGRAYVFTLEQTTFQAASHAGPERFRAMLATVTFDPASAAATPWDTSNWRSSTSTVFGLSMRVPFDWSITPGTVPWRPGTEQDPAIGTVDLGTAPLTTLTLTATNQRIPDAQSYEAWVTAYRQPVVDAFGASCFPDRSAWEPVTIDGRQGGLYTGCAYIEAQVLVDRRVYVLTLYDGAHLRAGPSAMAEDRPLFDAFLSGITLDPASAKD